MSEIINKDVKEEILNQFNLRSDKIQNILHITEKSDAFIKNISDEIIKEKNRVKSGVVFTLGVIGQMKAGKSSLLDSIYFQGREILPSAPTPLTAVLTLLKYSENEEYIVHYYSPDELYIIKNDYDSYKNNTLQDDTVKGHYELYSKMIENELNIQDIVKKGSEKISAAESNDYIGSKGKFSSIVKEVEMFINDDRIKDIFIVDTPGLNDPITSRELRTKEFIKSADAVLYISPASQFMDDYDLKSIKQLNELGIMNVIYVMSRFDEAISRQIHNEDFKSLSDLKNMLNNEGLKKITNYIDKTGRKIVAKDFNTFYAMPLMMKIHYKLGRNESLNEVDKFYFNKMTKNICSEKEFKEFSGILLIEEELNKIFEKKNETIKNKFSDHLSQIDIRLNEYIKELISKYENEIKILCLSESDFKKEMDNINKTKKETIDLTKKIGQIYSDKLNTILKEIKEELKTSFSSIISEVNSKGLFNKSDIRSYITNFHIKLNDIVITELSQILDDNFRYYVIFEEIKKIINDIRMSSNLFSDFIKSDIESKLSEYMANEFNIFFDKLNQRVEYRLGLKNVYEILNAPVFHINQEEIDDLRSELQNIQKELNGLLRSSGADDFIKTTLKDIQDKNLIFNEIDNRELEIKKSYGDRENKIKSCRDRINSLNKLLGV